MACRLGVPLSARAAAVRAALLHNRRVKQHRTGTELVEQAVKEGISLPGSEKLPSCRKLVVA